MIQKHLPLFAAAWLPLALAASVASAATSLSNSFKGFTGDSTLAATQAAAAAAGFNFADTRGATEIPPPAIDPRITFDSAGATFGSLLGGDGGRNFIRTTQTDYANVSFVSEVTWETFSILNQSAYFGLGSGVPSLFRIADWDSQFSAMQLFLEVNPTNPIVYTLKNRDGVSQFVAQAAPGLDSGTNRLRMAYDWFRKRAEFSIDMNYTGGAFVADLTTGPVDAFSLYGPTGWPSEPSAIYFGGDDTAIFKDFQVTVSTPSMRFGDLTMDGNITSADWGVLRANQLGAFSGDSPMQAYYKGDLNLDFRNNVADFALFKQLYDEANGVGAFDVMAAAVPEPSTACLILSAGVLAVGVVSRFRVRR